MKKLLLTLFTLTALVGHAQSVTPAPHSVPEKAVTQLEKMLRQTQVEVVIGRRKSTLPAEVRPMLNRILVQSANDFLAITHGQPTKEAYYKSLEAGLARLQSLTPKQEDREQVAEYFQDLLDIVGLESSEGRLMAFVEGPGTK
ncbi:DUF4844 domain-containing protein [Hymenobacter siberiensis]|jgi:hypothetical protein|uniref:DUF4844 domain-containing protein n=1 Tax=Hymenobacter siberiensis TaxID=2848396 RepID=UPI001C1E18B1|nr:DUF4844 domain-containing protein [Hymenobacter siberiensis]MBU6120326.1 DUF4844 domain-containing protein [Hymenobacter siberiensis]